MLLLIRGGVVSKVHLCQAELEGQVMGDECAASLACVCWVSAEALRLKLLVPWTTRKMLYREAAVESIHSLASHPISIIHQTAVEDMGCLWLFMQDWHCLC